MRKILLANLMLLLIGMGLVVISCSREEKSSKKVEEVVTQDTGNQVPKQAEEVTKDDVGSQTSKPQTIDAFSGEPINKNIFADYKGKRIYFCCANSRKTFHDYPEKYIERFRKLGITLEDTPTIK